MKRYPFWKTIFISWLILVTGGCEFLQEVSKMMATPDAEQQPAASLAMVTDAEASVTVDYTAGGQPVKNMIFGGNIEWVDNGDGIWDESANDVNAARFNALAETKPTSIRFPGGVHADTYHWKYAVGTLSSRQAGAHYYKTEPIPSNFGTDEFLRVCKRFNARPIFTVNIVSGTPAEAAEWVTYVNAQVASKGYPPVLYWEIGNEPYLENKFGRLSSQEYTQVYLDFANAIRAVDPTAPLGALFVGLELENQYRDKYGIGWNAALLKDAASLIDYASIHNAYYPGFIFNIFATTNDVFKQTYDGLKKVKADFTWLATLLAGKSIKVDISEYNTFFGINTRFDHYVATLGGAIYVANIIQDMMNTPIVDMAHYWSLLDNWHFGLFYAGTIKRPNFYVLKLYSQMQGKTLLPVSTTTGEVLKVLAVKDAAAGKLLVYVINNDLKNSKVLTLNLQNFNAVGTVTVQTIYNTSILASNESGSEQVKIVTTSLAAANPFTSTIKKHSIVLFTLSNR